MDYENFKTGFNKSAIFSSQTYGTKTTVEVDHSDLSLDEVMDAFQTLLIGMGYHHDSFKSWVIDRADEYNETDAEELKEKLEAWAFDNENDIVVRHQYESREDLENDFFGQYDENDKRMDIIGQNGNEGLHYDGGYRATDEDADEFSYDGGFDGKPHFEWGDEPEEESDLFEDELEPTEELKNGFKKYKKALKTLAAKQKKINK